MSKTTAIRSEPPTTQQPLRALHRPRNRGPHSQALSLLLCQGPGNPREVPRHWDLKGVMPAADGLQGSGTARPQGRRLHRCGVRGGYDSHKTQVAQVEMGGRPS